MMIIHLGLLSLIDSSDLPTLNADHIKLLDLAPGGVYIAKIFSNFSGSLLHYLFTLTLKGGLLSVALSIFQQVLLLGGTLSCGVRTFLSLIIKSNHPASLNSLFF
tara:strand:+ start:683 stop:997 length:315 start_codon:yes stop_codon:yes gene_type:complete